MADLARLRRLVFSRTGVILASLALAAALLAVGWLDNRATRRDLLALLESHAASVRETVAAAARASRTASSLAEAQVAARVRDNARLLAALDRRHPLDEATVSAIAAGNELFRVMVFGADGSRQVAVVPSGQPRGRGPGAGGAGPGPAAGFGPGSGLGPGISTLVSRVLEGGEPEVVGDLHTGRRAGAGRLAAAVRRDRGGAILVHADASAVLALQEEASLGRLLGDIVEHAEDVAYVSVATGDRHHAAGVLPRGLADIADPGQGTVLREVDGRPVLEFATTVEQPEQPPTIVRVGIRLDEVRRLEQRFLWRQVTTLLTTLLLGGLALGLVWLRSRYGALAEAHARAREALERRDRLAAMGELASTVAHEIRNPLNAIAMSAQRLEREALTGADEEAAGLIAVVRRESERINERIQQFLAFARPRTLALQPVALGPWLQASIDAARPTAALKHLDLTVDATQAGEATVDPEQLRQVLDNLLRNAIEATPAGGRIEVHASSTRREHRIVVRDTGPGIPPDVLPRIFDLYFTTKRDGTGVGLAISQQIVTAHGGRLEVESAPGVGTTFTIVVPSHP